MCEKKFVFTTEIIEQKPLIKDIYSLKVKYPKELIKKIKPGDYVNLYLNRKDLLLPRPISICRVKEEDISLVYKVVGDGTKELASYGKGDEIRISEPLGNSYGELASKEEVWLVGGGLGIPPLLELAHRLKNKGCLLNIVLGYRDEPFLIEEYKEVADNLIIVSELEGYGIKGNVMDVLKDKTPRRCYATGPKAMLKAVSQYCQEKDIEIQVSLEERMACGYGACLGCVCEIREEDQIIKKRVCKDGPIFDGRKVVWK